MIAQHILEEVVYEQFNTFTRKNIGTIREIDFNYLTKSHLITVLTGVRRCGKSTLLRQIARFYSTFYYINFDDERLADFEINDFRTLLLIFQKKQKSTVFFIDEIQMVEGWERFVRRLFEQENKVYITGSNSKLLSSELSTHLTGRYQKIELYPFSFKEFLSFKNVKYSEPTSAKQAEILKTLDDYISKGGFPEYRALDDKEYLRLVYNDIIYRDLIVRFGIKNTKAFKQLSNYLFTNFTKETSYNSLRKLFGISSPSTTSEYVSYLQQAYLLFECYKYDYSLKKQIVYNKKVYVIDTGLRSAIALNFSKKLGQNIENIVFLELKRRQKEVFFYKTKDHYEVDFIVHENPIKLIQVSYTMLNIETANREKRALISAMKELDLQKSIIITYNEESTIIERNKQIKIIPLWKFLINISYD
ncbi:MAG: ATP-binding protein [Bacteroidetes bacterium]|nr:MAG: ATP-binding protein [Bacteroidota bacterium]